MRLLLVLALVLVVSNVHAGVLMGEYPNQAAALAACEAFRAQNPGGSECILNIYGGGPNYNWYTYTKYPESYQFNYYYSGVCPDGQLPDYSQGELCVDDSGDVDVCGNNSNAPEGSVWDGEACVCPEGQTDLFGSDGSYQCVDELPDCSPSDPSFLGWVGDTAVCTRDNDCQAGYTGGVVDLGDGPQWVCLPDACDEGLYINGVCYTEDDMSSSPSSDYGQFDSDGDDVPDAQDGDIDGDGIPNDQDDDIDGDGIPNLSDPDPFGRDNGTATASGGCDQPPVCSGGDPQLCAILKQQWYAMCRSDLEGLDGEDFYNGQSGDFSDRISGVVSNFRDRISNSVIVDAVNDFFAVPGGGSCPVYHVSTWVFDITLDQWCSNEIPWHLISGIVIAVSLLLAIRIALL